MKYILPIQGTNAFRNDPTHPGWWKLGSPFHELCRLHEIDFLLGDDPFLWSTDLDGLDIARLLKFWKKKNEPLHRDWIAGGRATRLVFMNATQVVYDGPVRIIAHSHGGQVALYAAAQGLEIDRLVTVGMPVRADMMGVIAAARPNIDRWLHIHDGRKDAIAWAGAIGDGRIAIDRDFPSDIAPDIIDDPHGIGHSSVLRTSLIHWHTRGWFNFLKEV